MNDTQFRLLHDFLEKISASFAQLVVIQQARLDAEIKHMTIDDSLFQQVLDTANMLLTKESTDTTAIAAKDALITTLQAQLAPNPALAASASAFLANALLANPPAKPVVVYDPTATYAPGAVVTDSTGAIWTAVTPVVGEAPGVTAGNWTLTTPAPALAAATGPTTAPAS